MDVNGKASWQKMQVDIIQLLLGRVIHPLIQRIGGRFRVVGYFSEDEAALKLVADGYLSGHFQKASAGIHFKGYGRSGSSGAPSSSRPFYWASTGKCKSVSEGLKRVNDL